MEGPPLPDTKQTPFRGQRWHLVDERALDRQRAPAACPNCGNSPLIVQDVFGGGGFLVEGAADVEFCRQVHGAHVDIGDVLCWTGSTVTCSQCDWELQTVAALHRERQAQSRQRQFLALEEALAVAEVRLSENGDTKTLAQIAHLRLEADASL